MKLVSETTLDRKSRSERQAGLAIQKGGRVRNIVTISGHVLCLMFAAQTAGGQAVKLIGPGSTCATCRITLRELATVGGSEDADGLVVQTSRVAWTTRFTFLLGPTANSGEIVVFDRNGRDLTRFGKKGSGPGEFSAVRSLVVGAGDSVLVVDGDNLRLTIFTPGFKYARSLVLGGTPYDLLPVPGSEHVLAQYMATSADLVGYPIHLIAPSGRVTRSFGSRDGRYTSTDPMSRYRAIAVGSNGTVWSAYHHRYEIEAWDTLGRYLGTMRRDVDWFQSWKPSQPPPVPTLRSLWHDGRNLWVLINVPDREWKGPLTKPPDPSMTHLVWDTVIEVINPETGDLVAAQRFPNLMERINNGIVHSISEKEGVLRAQIWQLQLTR